MQSKYRTVINPVGGRRRSVPRSRKSLSAQRVSFKVAPTVRIVESDLRAAGLAVKRRDSAFSSFRSTDKPGAVADERDAPKDRAKTAERGQYDGDVEYREPASPEVDGDRVVEESWERIHETDPIASDDSEVESIVHNRGDRPQRDGAVRKKRQKERREARWRCQTQPKREPLLFALVAPCLPRCPDSSPPRVHRDGVVTTAGDCDCAEDGWFGGPDSPL